MERQVIQPKALPRPSYPFSLGIRMGNLIFTAGATGRDADGTTPSDIRGHTRDTRTQDNRLSDGHQQI